MKIEDCKTVPEFFGVERKGLIWIEGEMFTVYTTYIMGDLSTIEQDGKALVGCLTGQLKWSTTGPMTAEEEKIIREIAAWFYGWETIYMTDDAGIEFGYSTIADNPFGTREEKSKAYEVLAPILEKYGEIDLDDYRGNDNERD